jgi:uncharacterized protein YecE (DUF72 family)
MPLIAGTSGWQYKDWRGSFYPAGLPAARWLEHYATVFPTVENNGTFYRLAAPKTFADWRARTADGFVMTVKASRYLTHIRRLRDPAEPVARLVERMAQLGDRLGPVLVQLPPTMPADAGALDECLRQFRVQYAAVDAGRKLRVCVEFRHETWWSEKIRQLLTEHDAALCWSDRRGRPVAPLWRTASWGYLRLHEGPAKPWPHYGPQALRTWLHRIADTWPPAAPVFAYFNNDQNAAAPADARAFAALAARTGWPVASPASPADNATGPAGRHNPRSP